MAEFERGFSEDNTDTFAKQVHKDFRRNIYPRSLGVPELTRDEWLKRMAEIVTFATVLKVSYILPVATHKTSFLQLNPPHRQPNILS